MLLSRNSIKNRKIVKEKNERNECTAIGGSWYVACSSNSDWTPNTSANSPKWTILPMKWMPPTISLNRRTDAATRRNHVKLITFFMLTHVLPHRNVFFPFYYSWKVKFPVCAWFVIKKNHETISSFSNLTVSKQNYHLIFRYK